MDPITFTVRKHPSPNEVWVDFGLQLVGSLPVHSLTTMPMLPWVVAEVRRLSGQSSIKAPAIKQVRLCVSPSGLRCEPEPGKSQQWDPLICSSIFECKPQHVHKLIHNSHDPSYFACLIKDDAANKRSICYVFKADDQTKKANKLVTAPLLTGELRNAHARPPLQLSATQDSEDAMSIHVVKVFNDILLLIRKSQQSEDGQEDDSCMEA